MRGRKKSRNAYRALYDGYYNTLAAEGLSCYSIHRTYGAFTEEIMREAYKKLLASPMAERDLVDSAVAICEELDRFLVEKLWPEKKRRDRQRQEKEVERAPRLPHGATQSK